MLLVENLCKNYSTFSLKNVSFNLPKGYIMGFIGTNGAGKSTTIKSMLNIVKPNSGRVTIFGRDIAEHELDIKQDIGFMLGAFDYYHRTKLKKIMNVYKKFFVNWDEDCYRRLLVKFNLDENKKIGQLSAGMKVKAGLAGALSHNARLLILDEPTSGLDPVARDELLDLMREIIGDGEKSILFSTHITSDLDKCADYIILIKDGEIILNDTKDNIIDSHILLKGSLPALSNDLKSKLINYKTNSFGFSALALDKNITNVKEINRERPNLEDIMVYYNKGVKYEGIN